MKKSKIALKPYLDTIAGYCDTLSNEELTDIIIRLAKDVSTSGRIQFLEKIESCLPGRRGVIAPETDPVEQILNDTEIIKGLKQNKDTKGRTDEYLKWAEKIGKSRIEHIVSNKHRRAYERAAQVLGSLAEAYAAMGQKSKAVKILHKYYNEEYNRFSAFRREVKAVVTNSELLRNTGFI